MKKVIPWLFAVIGSISLIYYIVCGSFYSFTLSGLWIWLVFSLIMYFVCLWLKIIEPKIPENHLRTYKWGKRAVVSAAALFTASFLLFEVLLALQWYRGTDMESQPADTIIVLGATVEYDRPGDALRNRISKVYEVIKNNPHATVIACGGLGEDDIITEAECIKNELISMGVDPERILTEEFSTSTKENFEFCASLIPKDTKTVAVVTGGFHQFRAMLIGKSVITDAELHSVSAPCTSLKLPRDMVREFAAFVKNYISSNI